MIKYIFLIIGVFCVLADAVLMYLIQLADQNKFSMMTSNSMENYFWIFNWISIFALIIFTCIIDRNKDK